MWLRSILRVRRRYSSTYQFLPTAKDGGASLIRQVRVSSMVLTKLSMVGMGFLLEGCVGVVCTLNTTRAVVFGQIFDMPASI